MPKNEKKKKAKKEGFTRTLTVVVALWIVVLYTSVTRFAREDSTAVSYEKAFENQNINKQSLSLSNPLPEQLPRGFQPDVQNDYDYKSEAPSEYIQEDLNHEPSERTSPNNKYETYTGSRDDRVCMKKIDPTVERKHVKEGKIPKFVIIGADKCGTSALGKFLSDHPDVMYIGETYFFSREWAKGSDWIKSKSAGVFEDQYVLEKSPTYYRSPAAPKRMLQINPDMKVALVVCRNVKRLLSRYLHLYRPGETNDQKKSRVTNFFGTTTSSFMRAALENINMFDRYLERLYPDWKNPEKLHLLIDGLVDKFEKVIPPFRRGLENNIRGAPASSMIADGLWPVFLKYWQRELGKDRIITIDGSMLNVDPAGQIERLQDFFGLSKEIGYKNFIFHQNRGILCLQGSNGLPCCPTDEKGRSLGIEIDPEIKTRICEFFKPFDDYMLEMMDLDWPSWRDTCE